MAVLESGYLHESRPPKGKFAAFFNDGSGVKMFSHTDDALFTDEFETCSWDDMEDYGLWICLPTNFTFWAEENDG